MKAGPRLGCGCTTPDRSDEGRGDCGAVLGEPGTGSEDWLSFGFCTDESMDVGGASCGGETWGVIIAGSLGRFLCPSVLALSSRDDVPAGVKGGECMADAGDPGMEERCPECAEAVREAGEGEGAREGGSETGSKEKFSMRLACIRDFWSVDDRLRSSSSA